MEEEPPPQPPFWLQPATSKRRRLMPHLPSFTVFFSTGFLVTILCMLAIVLLVLVIPSVISLTHQVFRPSSVKRSWDSLNLVLILFAIICGFLGIRDRENTRDQEEQIVDGFNVSLTPRSPLTPNQQYSNWYEYGNEFRDHGHIPKLVRASSSYPDLRQDLDSWGVDYDYGHVPKLVRASSSYPDLRQDFDSWGVDYDHMPRYYDDSCTTNHTKRPPRSLRSIRSSRSQRELDGGGESTLLPPMLPMPPPTPPPIYYSKIVKSPRKEFESIGRRTRKSKVPAPTPLILKARPPTPPPPPTPFPPPPPPQGGRQFDKTQKKSVIKEIPNSIYQQSKKKKNKLLRRKSHENLKDLRQPSPPPTPPPPPPPSKPHNIFSPKKSKLDKKTKSSSINHPIPPKPTNFDPIYETIENGYESSVIPIPPPPPPPPFKLLPWKFVVDGDYIKINRSPKRGGSDESEFDEDGTITNIAVARNATPARFCTSPDVNTKADDFIARFKATLKLEKINSIKMEGRGFGLSPLGPDSSPSPSPSPHAMALSGSF